MTTATPTPPDRTAASDGAWLTRLRLNTVSRAVQRDLGNATALHRRVMSLVPDNLGDSPRARAGVLFRLETVGTGTPVLLIQSRFTPDASRLPGDYGEADTKDMHALLAALRPGLAVRYRLLGNAIRRCGRNSTAGRWKQAVPLHGEDADRWWVERATAAGLTLHTILSEPSEPRTARHRPADRDGAHARHSKPGNPGSKDRVLVAHQTTRFEGTATIQDADALLHALLHGIGRGKSYGCGLLSLAPGRQDG